MGRSYTPKYAVELKLANGRYALQAWQVRSSPNNPGKGRPTDANLKRYVEAYNASILRPGGVNEHLGDMNRAIAAEIRLNGEWGGDRSVLATYTAPMFQVF